MGLADRDYMHDRWRAAARSSVRGGRISRASRGRTILISAGLTLASIAVSLVDRYGIPSFSAPSGPIQRVPSSGDVFVTADANLRHGQSTFRVSVPVVDHENYVVLLSDARSVGRVMAIYCRSGDDVAVPVPVGHYRVRVASGSDWYGMRDLFGRTTHVEDVIPEMVAGIGQGAGIDFRRRPDGNLPTRTMWKSHFSANLTADYGNGS